MLKKLFLSQNVVLGIITAKSTTPKLNNHLLNQHFSFLISLRSFCTSESDTHPFAVSYLINKFGFTPQSALKAFNLKQVRFNTPDKPDSVITFFKNTFVTFITTPQCYFAKVSIFSIQRFMKTNKDAILCLIRHSTAFSMNSYHLTVDNVNLMSDFGVPNNVIGSLLKSRPSIFGSKDLIKSLEEVKCLGFHPSLATFGVALKAKKCLSKKLWDEKVDAFKKWGWSDEAVIRTFQLQPNLMLVSIDKIDLLMSFWVNQLGWNSLALIKLPQMFCYSLEKRIIPRASVMQFLLMKGLRKKNASLAAPFSYSEKIFLSKFVFSFKKESGYLLKLYEQKMKLACTMENNGIPFTN